MADKIVTIGNHGIDIKLQRICTLAGANYLLIFLSIDKLYLYSACPLESFVPVSFLPAYPVQFFSSFLVQSYFQDAAEIKMQDDELLDECMCLGGCVLTNLS